MANRAEHPRGRAKARRGGPRGGRRSAPQSSRARSGRSSAARRVEPRDLPPLAGPVEPAVAEDGSFRSGTVALLGRPNVGKSTLLNRLLGEKIAAVTHKPQTTRQKLLGVLHPPGAQLVLIDTPGYHQAKGQLNRFMVSQADQAIVEADVLGYLVEARADSKITPGNARLIEVLKREKTPIVLLLNKIDRVKERAGMLHQIQAYQEALPGRIQDVVPISATGGKGLSDAVRALARALPEGPALYEEGTLTDASERGIAAELIREKLMLVTQEELPYETAVSVDAFEDERPRIVRITATVHVTRSGQKAIVIGRGGQRIREIGTLARAELERFLGAQVFLELFVRVTEGWEKSARGMAELGYGREEAE